MWGGIREASLSTGLGGGQLLVALPLGGPRDLG